MKQISFCTIVILLLYAPPSKGQSLHIVSGHVVENETKSPLIGAVVSYNGDTRAITNENGYFEFTSDTTKGLIAISHIGFEILEVSWTGSSISAELEKSAIALDELQIVISKEEFDDSQSIERLGLNQISELPSIDFYSALGTLKDIDIVSHGLQFQSVNSRGFNSTENTRFVQIVDGMNNQSPGLGFALGNFNGIPELDLESVELRQGPESSSFGTNAFNGVLIMRSIDPFLSEGMTFSTKLAANRFNEGLKGYVDQEAGIINEQSIRYAKVVSPKVAFKVTATLFSATDWIADDRRNIGFGNEEDQVGENPSYDGVNVYGDEAQTLIQTLLSVADVVPDGPRESAFLTTRTGYREKALTDYRLRNYKTGAAFHWKLPNDSRLILQGNLAGGGTMYTSDNRVYLGEMRHLQVKTEISNPNWNVRSYLTSQRINKAYDTRFLALHLLEYARSDQEWIDTYEAVYGGQLISRGVPGGDHVTTRNAVDGGVKLNVSQEGKARINENDADFESVKNQFINTIGFENGAGFTDRSRLYHVDGDLNVSRYTPGVETKIGGSYRLYDPESGGVIFADSIGNDITLYEYGFFIQSKLESDNEKLVTSASVRLDKNENFGSRLSPGISVLYNLSSQSNLRFSARSGFRFPTIKEQFAFQRTGISTITGGLPEIFGSLSLSGDAFHQEGVALFNEAVALDNNPFSDATYYTRDQAEFRNLALLEDQVVQKGEISPIRPEKITTVEIGFRSYFGDNNWYVDINAYANFFKDFIGVRRVVKPRTSPTTDLFQAARQINQKDERDVYFVYNNANENVYAQGVSAKVNYTFPNEHLVSVNATWSHFVESGDDSFIPGFNTPEFKGNFSYSLKSRNEKFGFKGIVRMRESYRWRSNFGDGMVNGFALIDLQMSRELSGINSDLKFGVSNLLNTYYTDVFGGAQIGAIPFVQLTYNPSKFDKK